MQLIIIILVLYLVVILMDFIPRIKKSPRRVTVVYAIILVVTLVLSSLDLVGVEIPSPSPFIVNTIESLFPV